MPLSSSTFSTTNSQDGIDHLVRAVAGIERDVQLAIAGDGDAREGAAALCVEFGVAERVEWLGWVGDRALIAQLIASADVCIAPEAESELNALTSFVKIGEYMSLGAPIAAHRLPQTERVGGAAIAYAADMAAGSLTQVIENLLDDPRRARSLGDAARARFKQHLDWRTVGEPPLVAAYRNVFASSSGSA